MTPLPTTEEAASDRRREGCQLIQSEHPMGPGNSQGPSSWLLLPVTWCKEGDSKDQPPETRALDGLKGWGGGGEGTENMGCKTGSASACGGS